MFKVGCDKCALEVPHTTSLAEDGWIFFKTRLHGETKSRRFAVCCRECLAGFFELHEPIECDASVANYASVEAIREDLVRVADERNTLQREVERLKKLAVQAKGDAYVECATICDDVELRSRLGENRGALDCASEIREKARTLP